MAVGIVIGGPPSSGSSLLTDLIGKHSDILSFPETHLLSKSLLWENWMPNKEKLLKHKWKSPDWHLQSGVLHITDSALSKKCIQKSSSVIDFGHLYFSALAKQKDKQHWCEKTPANVYYFHKLSTQHVDIKPVLSIRNPYDSIASLLFRKITLLDAVCRTLLNLAFGYAQSEINETITVKYEELVSTPEGCLRQLFDRIGIPFEAQLLTNRNGNTKMEGWKHAEDGVISPSSIGRFSELSPKQQSEVMYTTEKIKVNKEHLEAHGVHLGIETDCTLSLLAKLFDYDIPETIGTFVELSTPILADKLKRKIKGYPSASPYPIVL